MPATPKLGLRYPPGTGVPPNVPLDLQYLSEDVEAALTGTTPAIAATPAAGWTSTLTFQKIGRLVVVGGSVTPASGEPTFNVTTGLQSIATLPLSVRPAGNQRFLAWVSGTQNRVEILVEATTGLVQLRGLTGATAFGIATATNLIISSVWVTL